MADATQFYVSGPCYLWAGIGSSHAYRFVGWSEAGFTVELTAMYEDVKVDYAGESPGDEVIVGMEAKISGTLSRYDETVALQIASFFGFQGTPGVIGQTQYGNLGGIGTLLHAEGVDFPLLLQAPYSFKNIFTSTMVPGFLFYSTYLADPNRFTMNIKTKKPEMGFRAIPVWGAMSGATFQPDTPPYNAGQLYTTNLPAALPGGQWPAVN